MKSFIMLAALALSVPVSAQVPGGNVSVGVDAGRAVDGTLMTAERSARDMARETRDAVEDGADRASRTSETRARVNAGAQVSRYERCYDGTAYYDPYYRDGSYYCRASVGAGASAGVTVDED